MVKKHWHSKIDWETLKLQFYKSEIMEVKPFILAIWNKWNWNAATNTKGWTDWKAIFLGNINKKATDELTQTLIEKRAILLTNMEEAKITGLQELAFRLTKNVKSMNVWTIGSIVNIFNNEQEMDGEKVDNTTSVMSLRKRIQEELAKKKAMGGKAKT